MLVMEAEYLDSLVVGEKQGDCLKKTINVRNNDQLTPLYLLCEQGFRQKYDVDVEEENLMHGLQKTVNNEIDDDALNLEKVIKKNEGEDGQESEETEATGREPVKLSREFTDVKNLFFNAASNENLNKQTVIKEKKKDDYKDFKDKIKEFREKHKKQKQEREMRK